MELLYDADDLVWSLTSYGTPGMVKNPMMTSCTWRAIKIPSGLIQPYEDVEDTLPWILNDVIDFEGSLKEK